MLGGDQYIADRIMAERVAEHERLAVGRRMAREARSSTRDRIATRQPWLSRQAHHLLSRLGRKLSALRHETGEGSLAESLAWSGWPKVASERQNQRCRVDDTGDPDRRAPARSFEGSPASWSGQGALQQCLSEDEGFPR